MKTYRALPLLFCALFIARPVQAELVQAPDRQLSADTLLAARKAKAERQRSAGKWLLAIGLIHAGIAVALFSADAGIVVRGCPRYGCFYDTGPIMSPIGAGFLLPGSVLIGVGAPLYSMGTRTLKVIERGEYSGDSLASDGRPQTQQELLRLAYRSLVHSRTGVIISGALASTSAALLLGGAIWFATDHSYHQAEALGMMIPGAVILSLTAFPLIYFSREYSLQKALLSRTSAEPPPKLSLAPILSSNLYGLGLSGTF